MISVDNILFMKENFPLIWDAYRASEDKQEAALVKKTASKVEGFPTLSIKRDERSFYLHSRYDPRREAQTIIDNFDGSDYEHVIFYGAGLGYHIEEFLNRYPHLTFSIYEPIPEVFSAYLSNFELNNLPQRRLHEIVVESSPADAPAFLQRTVAQIQKKILLLDLPGYRNIFPEQHLAFLEHFQEIISNRRTTLTTNIAFEKRWILNSLLNFKTVLNTPDLLVERAGYFKDQPAILVAAGPSLDYEIENLKQIKENGLAYIFSVGSAVNSLIEAGIHPHAQCTYDPGEANQQKVFARITEEQITDIPLIFGSSVGFEVVKNYPGKNQLHIITSQDSISSYLLKIDDKTKLDGVMDAPSIAVVTLQLLYKLGFNPIILVGQNLAYQNNRHYAGGIAYADDMRIDPVKTRGLIKVKDVEGNAVYTSLSFDRMRVGMEHHIKIMDGVEVINTTRGGASIEGTTYRTLDELIRSGILTDEVVDPEWCQIQATDYDRNYLKKRFARLYNDYEQLAAQLQDVNNNLEEIRLLKESRNYAQIERSWPKLDRSFNKVKKNVFYKQVIQPMNRVTYNLYFEKLPTARFEPDQNVKADVIIPSLGRAVYESLRDLQSLKPIMNDLKQYIEELL